MEKRRKSFFVMALLIFVAGLVFVGCASGPGFIDLSKESISKDFEINDKEKFLLYKDANTFIKKINGIGPKNMYYMYFSNSPRGQFIELPAGEYEILLDWEYQERKISGGYETITTQTYRDITIKYAFQPNTYYDLFFDKTENRARWELRTDKGVVPWATPGMNETEVVINPVVRQYFTTPFYIYFNADTTNSKVLRIDSSNVRIFLPNGTHTVYIRQSAEHSNVNNRQRSTISGGESDPVTFTASGSLIEINPKPYGMFTKPKVNIKTNR